MKKNVMKRLCVVSLVMLLVIFCACAPASAVIGKTYITQVKGLHVHAEPKGSSDVIASLKKGTKVTHIDKTGNWWKISFSGDKEGYVYSKYLTTNEGGEELKKNSSYRIKKSCKVYNGPRKESGKIGSISKGAKVKLIKKQGEWAGIRIVDSGKNGWVLKKYLVPID